MLLRQLGRVPAIEHDQGYRLTYPVCTAFRCVTQDWLRIPQASLKCFPLCLTQILIDTRSCTGTARAIQADYQVNHEGAQFSQKGVGCQSFLPVQDGWQAGQQ